MVRTITPFALLVWLLATAPPAARAQLPTQSKIYRYQAVNRDLVDVLRGFAADQRLNLVLDPGLPRPAISEQVEMRPIEFLDYITGKYGLAWYYDGASLYIVRGDNMWTQPFRTRYTSPARVIEAMKALNAYSERFPFRILEKEGVILVVGPHRLVQMTGFVINMLEANGRTAASAQISIAVFRLKYASAADQTFNFADSSITVPGVATVLQSVISGQAVRGAMSIYLPRDVQGLRGRGLDRYSTAPPRQRPNLPPPLGNPAASSTTESQPPTASGEPQPDAPAGAEDQGPPPPTSFQAYAIQPTISADARINAVVIRDYPERMPSYQKVIEALDRPTGLVEITAQIIDVRKEGAFEWGLPFDTQWTKAGQTKQFSLQLTSTDAANFAVTLLKDQGTVFMQNIKALEQEGNAQVVSRPSLLTMDNIEAQINNSETFYVRVEGSYEVDLFDVSIGTKLKILPRIIEQDGERVVKLVVQVDDGNVLEQTVDEIPRIRSDSLTTQAVLRENESLLIGGLFREEQSVTEARLPVLGRLPGIGFLFRTEERNTDCLERLILIEPRIVALPTANGWQQWAAPLDPADLPYPSPPLPRQRPAEVETLPPHPQAPTEDAYHPPSTSRSAVDSGSSARDRPLSQARLTEQSKSSWRSRAMYYSPRPASPAPVSPAPTDPKPDSQKSASSVSRSPVLRRTSSQ